VKSVDKRRQEAAAAARKRRKRAENALAKCTAFNYAPSNITQERLRGVGSTGFAFTADDLPAAGTGSYVGKRRTSKRKRPWTLGDPRSIGFGVRTWDGV
jgi:hypothetical protein